MPPESRAGSTPSLERDEELMAGLGGLAAGRRLDRYELLAPVGRGGMAVVWAAQQLGSRGFSKLVAVKTMLPALSSDPRFEKMFVAEASLATSLEHENICRILDLGESDGLLYLVMEWVEGDTLAALLSARPKGLSPAVAVRIALDVASGLRAAHESRDAGGGPLGIVHRDVSPQNILVGLDGRSKISDFGIAKINGVSTTQAGFVKGKIRYMAPEQIYCEDVDERTDVFALGVVLYEATTGVHPFAGPTDAATLGKIAAPEEAASPRSAREDYPRALEAVVARAIAKEPSARFGSMAELASALERAVEVAGVADVAREAEDALGETTARRRAKIQEAVGIVASSQKTARPARTPRARTILGVVAAAAAAGITVIAGAGSRSNAHGAGPSSAVAGETAVATIDTASEAAPPRAAATPIVPVAIASRTLDGPPPRSRAVTLAASQQRAATERSPPSVSASTATSAPKAGVLETRE